jgi:hypothetical protein
VACRSASTVQPPAQKIPPTRQSVCCFPRTRYCFLFGHLMRLSRCTAWSRSSGCSCRVPHHALKLEKGLFHQVCGDEIPLDPLTRWICPVEASDQMEMSWFVKGMGQIREVTWISTGQIQQVRRFKGISSPQT